MPVSTVSASTMGLMLSKKNRRSEPVSREISCASASLVSGPVAMTTMASSGIAVTSSRRSSMRGSDADGRGDFGGEDLAVHRERVAARHARLAGRFEQQRIEPAQFFLEQPRRRVLLFGFERIAAHQFRQPVGLVRRRTPYRTHLVQHHVAAAPRHLPGRFGAREPAADDVYRVLQKNPPLAFRIAEREISSEPSLRFLVILDDMKDILRR